MTFSNDQVLNYTYMSTNNEGNDCMDVWFLWDDKDTKNILVAQSGDDRYEKELFNNDAIVAILEKINKETTVPLSLNQFKLILCVVFGTLQDDDIDALSEVTKEQPLDAPANAFVYKLFENEPEEEQNEGEET